MLLNKETEETERLSNEVQYHFNINVARKIRDKIMIVV